MKQYWLVVRSEIGPEEDCYVVYENIYSTYDEARREGQRICAEINAYPANADYTVFFPEED